MTTRRLRTAIATALTAAGLLGTAVPAHASDTFTQREFVRFEADIAKQVDRYWAATIPAYGVRYAPAKMVAIPAGKAKRYCGDLAGDPREFRDASPAYYCIENATVYLSTGWMYGHLYREYGAFGAAVAVAHEFGHHVQREAGVTGGGKAVELQADCLAGIWSRQAFLEGEMGWGGFVEGGLALYSMGDKEPGGPDPHGTADERVHAFTKGAKKGVPTKC